MPNVIALDIGGTKIEGVLFNNKFQQLKKKRVYFKKKNDESVVTLSKKHALAMITGLIDELRGGRISGIGISIPDVITKDGSFAADSKIKSLGKFPLGKYLRKKYRCRVTVNNDADCIAYGEARHGAGKGYKNVIGIIWGTGIGAGMVLDGRIYSGPRGSAGEFGHNIVDVNGPKERLGFRGTVEAFAGGPDLVRIYKKMGGRIIDPDPKKIYTSKEPTARKASRLSLTRLAMGLAGLMNVLDPEVIVMGGGQSNLPVYRELNRLTKQYTYPAMKKDVRIIKNKLGDSAGIYGAAALAFGK